MLFNDSAATNPLTILDKLVYLEQNESVLTEEMIPLIESNSLHTILVDYRYADIVPIDKGYTVVVDEADVVLNPSILREYRNMAVRPLSKLDEEYQLVEDACDLCLNEAPNPNDPRQGYRIVQAFANYRCQRHPNDKMMIQMTSVDDVIEALRKLFPNLNMHFIDKGKIQRELNKKGHFARFRDGFIVDLVGLPAFGIQPKKAAPPAVPTLQRYLGRAKDALWDNKGKISAGLVAAAGAAGLYKYISHKLESKPKSAIGKRIAALRHIYTAWMEKAKRATDSSIAVKLRKAASTVLQVIDMLLAKIQNSAERTFRMEGGMT